MSEMHNGTDNLTTNKDVTRKGPQMTFLTPGWQAPHLKTTVTRPQSVFMESLSPIYHQSISSSPPLHLQDMYNSVLISNGSTPPNDFITTGNTDTDEEIISKVKLCEQNSRVKCGRNSESVASDHQYVSEQSIEAIEAQIMESSVLLSKNTKTHVERDRFLELSSHVDGCHNKENTTQRRPRAYTASFCSSCSVDDSVIAQSRCSTCDGCSSTTCSSVFSQSSSADVPRNGAGDCNNCFTHPLEMSLAKMEGLLDAHLSFDQLDPSNSPISSEIKSRDKGKTLKMEDDSHKFLLSNEQLMFLLLRIVLSKYRQLIDNITVEQEISKSQRRSIVCLIQAVILLSRRVKNTSHQWNKTQINLKLIQMEHQALRKQQRTIYVGICILLVFNVCNIPPVRQRITTIVKFFGIVENVRKINRLRKMVAENWRNIPSLLTDFWRIFIFRSSSRLKNS